MPSSITIRALRDDERAWASAQYAAMDFAATPPDAIALVAERDGTRVGLGRLVPHQADVVELGGIWTDEVARGQGIARAMVHALLERHGSGALLERGGSGAPALWCIPFVHLGAFYRSFGFADRAPPWPAPIAAKVADCIALKLPEVLVLAR